MLDMDKAYLDEKFGELRRAQLATAAATIYAALLEINSATETEDESLRDQAARDAVALYYNV